MISSGGAPPATGTATASLVTGNAQRTTGETTMAQTGTSPAGSDQSLGDLVALAAKDVSQLIRGEISLAKIELRGDLKRIGIAAALLAMSAFVACLMLVLLCFAYAYGLMALHIWGWASFLIVAGTCLLLIGFGALIAVLRIRRGDRAAPHPGQRAGDHQVAARRRQEAGNSCSRRPMSTA